MVLQVAVSELSNFRKENLNTHIKKFLLSRMLSLIENIGGIIVNTGLTIHEDNIFSLHTINSQKSSQSHVY